MKKAGANAETGEGVLTRERMLVLVLLVATALAFYICYRLAYPFLPAIAWALALAVVAHPLHEWLARHIPNQHAGAALAVFIVALVIVAPALFVTDRLVRQAFAGSEMIKAEMETGHLRSVLEASPLAPALHWVESNLDLPGEVQKIAANITSTASTFVTGSFWVLVQLIITLFVLFYFFRDRRVILRGIRSLSPLSQSETDKIFSRVTDTIYATIYGTLAVAMVQGLLGGLIFWWLGLPAPALWGLIMGLLSIVPVLGAFVIWLPAALLLALQGSWIKAAILVGWGLTAIGMIDNLLYPTLVGSRLRMHTLPVFFSILGGLLVFGASGIILGPVTLSVTDALLEVWRRRTAAGQTADANVEA
jgi:predicted PurR-regulated permease PerM